MFVIQQTIDISISCHRLFQLLTSSDDIPRYFPILAVESPWTVGKALNFHGEINGEPFTDYGTIEVLQAPTHFQYRYWSTNHGTVRAPENHLTISYRLEATATGTTLHLEHRNICSETLYEQMNTQGWPYLLNALKAFAER
uniref:SRPBCC family protein n=1 Tax=Thaumasiovibrio occultus TaxID=1891184 RepID=UPI000B360673|nr:SRPBCC family protein [Thaumasiovibrio occultus]